MSKAFLIGIFIMPLFMGGGIAFQAAMEDRVDLTPRKLAVYDPAGELWATLEAAAAARNEHGIWALEEDGDPQGEGDVESGERKQMRPKFILERYEPAGDERPDVVLSDRVRDDELHGFALLDPSILGGEESERPFAYHTDEPTFTELPKWLEGVVNQDVRSRRFREADMDQALAAQLSKEVKLTTWGLTEAASDGTIKDAEKDNDVRTFLIPFGSLMLLFMLVMTTAPQLMNQVLEEKMQRISEVLVSSVTPFQLMLGKLLGSVAVSSTLAAIYLGGVAFSAHHFGVSHYIPLSAYGWFVLMMVFALLMYGSLFGALGSACSELRDAQSLMAPAMIMIMIPIFAVTTIIESPNGSLATALTYFPTATPMIFLLRLLAPPGPPAWELITAPLMCLATTVVLLWASGKIFRVGVLSQGQAPTARKLVSWVFSK
jgi:ABC-2 type transport system permease protein